MGVPGIRGASDRPRGSIAFVLQTAYEMASDESPRPAHQHPCCHSLNPELSFAKLRIDCNERLPWTACGGSTEVDRWYALTVAPRHEFRVKDGLASLGEVEAFLPTYQDKRLWSDRTKVIDVPLFGGYVFARFDPARSAFPSCAWAA